MVGGPRRLPVVGQNLVFRIFFFFVNSICVLKLEFAKFDFGLESIVVFFCAYSSVYRKRHYRVPIVVFLTNATKKMSL